MDFTKLKLVSEGVTLSNNLAIDAENKASEQAKNVSAPTQHNPIRKQMQLKQASKKVGKPEVNPSIEINAGFDPLKTLRTQKEVIKLREKLKVDWRNEIMEAANPDDDPNHPYVEVMPHMKYKMKEFEQNSKKAAVKDKMKGEKPITGGVNEEILTENPAPGDYQRDSHKKPSGKFVGKGPGTDNKDRTATPKENLLRRAMNKKKDKAPMQQKALEPMTKDAIADK